MPKSLSRMVTGFGVPHLRSSCRRVAKKYTSLLNGESNNLSQFIRLVRSGRVWVLSLWRPGWNTSTIVPSLTNAASCDSRTVSWAPFWISMSCIG